MIEAIKRYVEQNCKAFLLGHSDVEDIEYRHRNSGDAFIKISTAFGTANFYDVTDMQCEDICILISTIMTGTETNRIIRDREALREVAALFN